MVEYWDLYDKNRNKINKVVKRGDYLSDDEYHLVVNAWIKNSNDEFLITQRAAHKSYAFMWECTGGSVLSNETSLQAAIREVKEELGVDVSKCNYKLVGTKKRYYKGCPDILDVWIFECDIKIEDVIVQEEEVNDAMWASASAIKKLYKEGKFEANAFYKEVLKSVDNDVYYIGFNANNAICNDKFFKGSITLYPTKERGNIYYSKELLSDTKSEEFMKKYHDFVHTIALEKQKRNKNTYFICFNEKIRRLCSDMDDINIIRSNDKSVLDLLNSKFETRKIAKKYMPILEYKTFELDDVSYDEIKNKIKSNKFVIQAETGAGGDSTYLVCDEKDMPNIEKKVKYSISKYVKNTPLNITMVIYDDGIQLLPISAQLILLTDKKFKYVGGDFVFPQSFDKKVISYIENISLKIAEEIKLMGYRGVLGIDYIYKDGILYFMEINPRFQSSTFLISQALRNVGTDVGQMHFNALVGKKVPNLAMLKLDYSFLNCNSNEEFKNIKNYTRLTKGYFKPNKSSNYRKIFNRSIINEYDFEKE